MTTKTTVLIASGALAIAVAGGMGYRQIRHALLARTYQTRAATARAEAGKVSALPPSSPAQVDTGEPSASTSGILPVSASKLSTRPSKPATLLPTATARELYELILHGYPELGRGARDRMIARQVRDAFIARGSPEGEMKLWLELIKEMRLDGRWETSPELLPLWLGLYQMLVDSRSWRSQTTDLSLFMLLDDEAHAGTRNAIVGFGALLHRLLLAYAGQGRAEDARRWLGEAIAEIEALLSQVPAGEEDAETVRRKLRRAQTLLGGYSEKLDVLWERSVRALEEGERSREERLSRIQELETSLQAGAFETAPEEAKALIELGQWYYNMEEYERAIQCCEKAAQKAPAMSRDLSVWIRDTRKLAEIQSWTAEEQMQLARSEYNLRQIGSAMSGYAGSHVCNLPSSLEELVDHGYIADPEVLVDPLSGERFEWMSGLSANSAGPQIVARGAGKNGVVVVLEVDLSAAAAPSDTRFGLPFNVDTKFEQPFEKAAQEDADAGVSLGPIGESLKAIGLAIHMYAADYEERLPVSLEALVKEGYITDPKTIIDPASGKPYQYTSGLAANAHLNVPVITATEGSETYTLYVDGHVTRTEQ